ncbi:isoform 4 of protein NLRC3 [Aspergillus udagawae]|uniref:Isoform 4 of protein NLRC3 n=1 Tax=Aspergillus udagawae TaxID=91492 RepID=A0ABQ1BE80_9EURO|nr:isoform 4 of protein NLRC3 [Aspergillus udagawae]
MASATVLTAQPISLDRLRVRDSPEVAQAAEDENASPPDIRPRWSDRILAQGTWDQTVTPDMLRGASSLPMPVEISDEDSLTPFFNHLKHDGSYKTASDATGQSQPAVEPHYNVPTLEFDKGVLYEDGRMDLCKMALGPPNISTLMHSLRYNTFVRHFLLGNNIIGPAGAQAIADFVKEVPDRIDTWYLAGNCIDGASLAQLTDALVKSPAVTNLWLKRNPLGPESVDSLFRLITKTPNLRTLDLDQTELGDAGVAALFTRLAEYIPPTPLSMRILYLSATGVSTAACEAISRYLASPHCPITSLYISSNPIGDAGAKALAKGLQQNKTLQRLSLQSVGLTDEGATALISSLQGHPALETFDMGQAYSTQDLNARFNYLSAECTISALCSLVTSSTPLSYLALGPQPFCTTTALPLMAAAQESKTIMYLSLKPLIPSRSTPKDNARFASASKALRTHTLSNIRARYNKPTITYEEWEANLKRWCVSDDVSVRKIDSVYRNRAAQKARRGEEVLRKRWADEERVILEEVMQA